MEIFDQCTLIIVQSACGNLSLTPTPPCGRNKWMTPYSKLAHMFMASKDWKLIKVISRNAQQNITEDKSVGEGSQ